MAIDLLQEVWVFLASLTLVAVAWWQHRQGTRHGVVWDLIYGFCLFAFASQLYLVFEHGYVVVGRIGRPMHITDHPLLVVLWVSLCIASIPALFGMLLCNISQRRRQKHIRKQISLLHRRLPVGSRTTATVLSWNDFGCRVRIAGSDLSTLVPIPIAARDSMADRSAFPAIGSEVDIEVLSYQKLEVEVCLIESRTCSQV